MTLYFQRGSVSDAFVLMTDSLNLRLSHVIAKSDYINGIVSKWEKT
jgi:hypothetical protein